MKKLLLVGILWVCVMTLAPVLNATTLSYSLDQGLNGSPNPLPNASLLATFDDQILTAPGSVQLKLSVSGLTEDEYVSSWYFNVNPFKQLFTAWLFPGPTDKGETVETDVIGTTFNYVLDYTTNAFHEGTSIALISSSTNITTGLFDFKNSGGYYSAAKVENGTSFYYLVATSPFVGPGPEPGPIPEPATLILLGTGLAGVAGLSRKKLLQ